MIERDGIDALTLREIGKRLGVSRSAPYKHFKDKAALLSAISQAGFVEFGNAIETAKKSAVESFAAQMDAMFMAYVRFANEHRAKFDVMFAALTEGGVSAEGSGRGFAIVEQTIREAQQRGEIRPFLEEAFREAQLRGEVRPGDVTLLTRVFWALVHGATMLRMDGDDLEPDYFIRFSSEVLRSGLCSAVGVVPLHAAGS